MSLSIIAAIAGNNVIGSNNKLPWTIPEDLDHFYELVDGKMVIMGHKTYTSIGRPIEDSKGIVLSHDSLLQLPRHRVVNYIDNILYQYQNSDTEAMVIGGASIYEQFLPFVNKMYLTLIKNNFVGDTYFPEWQKDEWLEIDRRASYIHLYYYSFVTLQRKKPSDKVLSPSKVRSRKILQLARLMAGETCSWSVNTD